MAPQLPAQRVVEVDRRSIDERAAEEVAHTEVVLDIGCGIRPQSFFVPRVHLCCEAHDEYVRELYHKLGRSGGHVVLQGTAQQVLPLLPDRSVDSIFLLDFIEHLTKEDGLLVISHCERIARRQIVLFTPLGFAPQHYDNESELDGWGLHGTRWQEHRSGWGPEDFGERWRFLVCRDYHHINGKGELLDPPWGAFWAIRDFEAEDAGLPVKGRFGLVSHTLPPDQNGQAVALARVLSGIDPASFVLISSSNADWSGADHAGPAPLPVPLVRLANAPPRAARIRAVAVMRAATHVCRGVLTRARQIREAIRRHKLDALVACSGDQIDLMAAALAAYRARIRFYPYMFDDYAYQFEAGGNRNVGRLARVFERLVAAKATRWIVPNERLASAYQARYGARSAIVRNPSGHAARQPHDLDPRRPTKGTPFRIVYTGSVYTAQLDALRNLTAALDARPDLAATLVIYSAAPPGDLLGPPSASVRHEPACPPDRVVAVQREADVLFLPLAFRSPYPQIIATSSPGKLGDYLASGRPLLVHAPADSFVSEYVRQNECGYVADRDSASAVAEQLDLLLSDASLREQRMLNAVACAARDFAVEASRRAFVEAIES